MIYALFSGITPEQNDANIADILMIIKSINADIAEKDNFISGGAVNVCLYGSRWHNLIRMTNEETLDIFRQTKALLEGHFILRSGLHSRQYFQCALALQEMPIVEKLGAALAEKLRGLNVRTVIAPAMGGLVIGQEVARQLGCRFIFAEKENGKLVLRRGFKIAAGERMLVVEDVVTRGGRVAETIEIVKQFGGEVVGVAMLVDRSDGKFTPGMPLYSLLKLNVETFEPTNLPEDLKALPAEHPGS